MNQNSSWPYEKGSAGVLAPGRWLWLRAMLWAIMLSSGTMVIFLATQFLSSWLHLPRMANYPIVLLLPIAAFVLYAFAVHKAERRFATEVLPSFPMLGDLVVGGSLGFFMVSAMLGLLAALGLYHVEWHRWRHAFDAFLFDSYLSACWKSCCSAPSYSAFWPARSAQDGAWCSPQSSSALRISLMALGSPRSESPSTQAYLWGCST